MSSEEPPKYDPRFEDQNLARQMGLPETETEGKFTKVAKGARVRRVRRAGDNLVGSLATLWTLAFGAGSIFEFQQNDGFDTRASAFIMLGLAILGGIKAIHSFLGTKEITKPNSKY